ncbi:MAG: IS1595 family transposase [Candidatus Dadabacteria bacterium]|nr:IS1595 family transposase [Candidatus Dadabacteria bacterium]
MSLLELMDHFDTEEKAREHFEKMRWEGGRCCPRCGSTNTKEASHKKMPYWCSACRKYFSVKTGTLMEESKLSYRKWLMAIYLMATSLKGVSSTKLGNDLGIQQKSAWFLGHRIRQGWANNASQLFGKVFEIDEAYFGGLEKNKHKSKKLNAGRGTVGKDAVVAIKEREGKKVRALRVESTDAQTLHWIILKHAVEGSTIYTDDHKGYTGIEKHGFKHESVHHSLGEYVKGEAHVNGVESFWALLKRGYYGVYHRMSVKHLQKYIDEFSNRNNVRPMDTMDQINATINGLVGKRLKYKELIA